MKHFILFSTFLTLSIGHAWSSPDTYKTLKDKINRLENSIIQEFSIDYPKNRQNLAPSSYAKLAGQVEIKYNLQQALFNKLESELFNIDKSLPKQVKQGELTAAEAEKLKNSIEYANRIILKTRRAEIAEMYSEFMSSLDHSPELKDVHKNLAHMRVPNCSIENLQYNESGQQLSFEIKQKNNYGSWTSSSFNLSQQDITSGQLSSKLENHNRFNPVHNIITQFQHSDYETDVSQRFTLLQDEYGNILEARFFQETTEPLIEFMGLKLGTQKVTKFIECGRESLETALGPKPASK